MNFFEVFSFDSRIERDHSFKKIPIILEKYENVIFSLGTYERGHWDQLFYSFKKNIHPNSIIFAIDSNYSKEKFEKYFIHRGEKFKLVKIYKNIIHYTNEHYNIDIFFICNNISSTLKRYIHCSQISFDYLEDCCSLISDIVLKEWNDFNQLLNRCNHLHKKIFINNWVFTNMRFFEEVEGKQIYRNRDNGHFFEYFPELPIFLKKAYIENNKSNQNIFMNILDTNTYEKLLVPIENCNIL